MNLSVMPRINNNNKQLSFRANVFASNAAIEKGKGVLVQAAEIAGKDSEGVVQVIKISHGFLFVDVKTKVGNALVMFKKRVSALPFATEKENLFLKAKSNKLLQFAEKIAMLPETVKFQ